MSKLYWLQVKYKEPDLHFGRPAERSRNCEASQSHQICQGLSKGFEKTRFEGQECEQGAVGAKRLRVIKFPEVEARVKVETLNEEIAPQL